MVPAGIYEYYCFGESIPVSVLKIVDWKIHLSGDVNKNGTLICNRFLDHMKNWPIKELLIYSYDWQSFKCTTGRQTTQI